MRALTAWVALGPLLMAYASTNQRSSRRRMQEAQEVGLPGLVDVSFREAAESEDLTRHQSPAVFDAPWNWMDRALFGAPGPVVCVMWRLSE